MSKDWEVILQQRRMDFMDLIEKNGSIGQAKLQNLLGWGDGKFERTKRAVLELYPEEVFFNKRTKLYAIIRAEEKQLQLGEIKN